MNNLDINSYGNIISFCDFKSFSKLSTVDKNFNNLSNKYNFRIKQQIMNVYKHEIIYDVYREYNLTMILDVKNPYMMNIVIESLLGYLKIHNIKMKSSVFLWLYDYVTTLNGMWDKDCENKYKIQDARKKRDIPKTLRILNEYKNKSNSSYFNYLDDKLSRQQAIMNNVEAMDTLYNQ